MSKNPLTFKHIADATPLPATPPISPRGGGSVNSEVHNTGEVWASMLWECYSNLLNDTARLSFAQAQDRMKRYLVASFKMTPSGPDVRPGARRIARRHAGAGRDGCATCASPVSPSAASARAPWRPTISPRTTPA